MKPCNHRHDGATCPACFMTSYVESENNAITWQLLLPALGLFIYALGFVLLYVAFTR